MDILVPAIERYLHELSNPRDPILREMEVLAAERRLPISAETDHPATSPQEARPVIQDHPREATPPT
jgi:hypothetical protein